ASTDDSLADASPWWYSHLDRVLAQPRRTLGEAHRQVSLRASSKRQRSRRWETDTERLPAGRRGAVAEQVRQCAIGNERARAVEEQRTIRQMRQQSVEVMLDEHHRAVQLRKASVELASAERVEMRSRPVEPPGARRP